MGYENRLLSVSPSFAVKINIPTTLSTKQLYQTLIFWENKDTLAELINVSKYSIFKKKESLVLYTYWNLFNQLLSTVNYFSSQ